MTLTNKNRGLVDGDLEWLKRKRVVHPFGGPIPLDAEEHNARINRILQALSTTQEEDGNPTDEDRQAAQRFLHQVYAPKVAPTTPPEREAVERLEAALALNDYVRTSGRASDPPPGGRVNVGAADLRTILSLLESRHGG